MKKTMLLILAIAVCFSVFANGFNLNTMGARAFGMGGAMIGLADDPTAFYWNPAGLATQGNAIQLIGHDIIPTLTYEYPAAGIKAETEPNHYPPPAMFWNHKLSPKMALGFGIFVPSAIGAEWDGTDLTGFNGPPAVPVGVDANGDPIYANNLLTTPLEWESKVLVVHAGPSIAYQATDKLSLGATAELSYGIMELHMGDDMWSNFDINDPTPEGFMDTQYNEESTGMGFGVNLGLKYAFSDDFSIGATYHSPVHFAFKQDDVELITPGGTMEAEMTRYVTWPLQLGFGTAVKPA
ncbi:MAG: outer membrane protein transport protein, partial [Candidatus Zophobacter franzmannii]|nr:outer membrane protein transport protein [Candidatus Zophobacter franzmannii]